MNSREYDLLSQLITEYQGLSYKELNLKNKSALLQVVVILEEAINKL